MGTRALHCGVSVKFEPDTIHDAAHDEMMRPIRIALNDFDIMLSRELSSLSPKT